MFEIPLILINSCQIVSCDFIKQNVIVPSVLPDKTLKLLEFLPVNNISQNFQVFLVNKDNKKLSFETFIQVSIILSYVPGKKQP